MKRNKAKKVFGSSYDTAVDDIGDKIRQEWKVYQVEKIPSDYFQKDVNFPSSSSTKHKISGCVLGEGIDYDSTKYWNFHQITGHVLEIFSIVMVNQSTHTYLRFLRLYCICVMPSLMLKRDFRLINILIQYTEILSMRRPL